MDTEKNAGPYRDVKIVLRRDGTREWALLAVEGKQVVSFSTLICDEETAMERAQTLAGWLDAELVLEKVGA